jgi:hypothetical protein
VGREEALLLGVEGIEQPGAIDLNHVPVEFIPPPRLGWAR